MERTDRIGSGLLLLFGLFTIAQAHRLPLTDRFAGLGPGFLPFWLGVLLVLVSAFGLVRPLIRPRALANRAADPDRDHGGSLEAPAAAEPLVLSGEGSEIVVEAVAPERPGGWPRVVLTLAAIVGYTLLLESLGYILATLLLLGSLLVLLRQRVVVTVAVAVVGAVGTYTLFHTWLKVPLPRGIFGF